MNARQGATSFQGPRARLGESPRAVWDAVSKLNGGVVEPLNGYRMTYPTLRVVGGDDFRIGPHGRLQVVDKSCAGMAARDATDAQVDKFHRDLSADRVQVVLLSSPGYASGYLMQQVVRELHSPSGNSFVPRTRPSALSAILCTRLPQGTPPMTRSADENK